MYKIVVFDLDGTLANTLEDLADAVNKGLSENGLPTHSLESYKKMVGDGILNLIKRAIAPVTDEKTAAKVKEVFDRYYREHSTDKTCAYPGTQQLLEVLQEKGILTAVLSNKPHQFVEKILKKIFPHHCFDLAWGKRPEYDIKPNPDSLNAILSLTGIDKSQCLYVGDSDVDCHTARNAGVKCCGVSWGFRGREELEKAGADFIIDTPMEMREKLNI